MSQPKLLPKPWAADGLKNDIPVNRTVGLAQESASYADGFPSITMTPIALGGKPPSGKDMNGVLNEISAHVVYQNQGGRYRFDRDYCTAIGGYPKGAVLMNNAGTAEYISTVSQNTNDPNTGGSGWLLHAGAETLAGKADKTTQVIAGNGLTGGGNLIESRTLAIGTPGTITASSTNAVQSASHTHAIDSSILVPSGSVVFVAGDTVPAGWLKANGAAVSRTTYASLFAAIGTRYGAGNGSTTFNLPDLRGLFVRGWDDGRGVDSGRALGSRQESANQDHYHALPTTSAGQHEAGIAAVFVDNQVSTSQGVATPSSLLSESGNNPMLTGGVELRTYSQSKTLAAASESRPVNMALMACIKI